MCREEEGMKQVSLDNFGENTLKGFKETVTTVREYEFTEPFRRCSICRTFKPLSEFRRIKSIGRIKKYRRECKECAVQTTKEYRENNPEKAKESVRNYQINHPDAYRASLRKYHAKEETKCHYKEQHFLHGKGKPSVGYFQGGGVCVICGEIDPLVFENHHLFPNNDFVMSLCGSCHKKYHAGTKRDLHMQAILRAIEGTPHLWKGMAVSKNVAMFNPEDAEVVDVITSYKGEQIEVVKKK